MTLIFSPGDRTMLGEHVRYLKHDGPTREKISRDMEIQVFTEKTHFSRDLTTIF